MGFPVPFSLWMQGPWAQVVRDVLFDRRARERGLVNHRALGQLMDAHAAGTTRGGDSIWALLNLELWYRTFVDGDGVQTLSKPAAASKVAAERMLGATA
jgi:asparagine synthase (glutamine-hydrolysing)